MSSRTYPGWTPARLGRLDGVRAVVTGASNGVGLETARELARCGADVVLAVRDTALGRRRADEIGGRTEVRRLDLADLASVRAFAADLDGEIDLLINNAGVFPLRQERTTDGFELTLGTNFLGPYALTALLLPQVTGRVVNVASNSHTAARFDRSTRTCAGAGRALAPMRTASWRCWRGRSTSIAGCGRPTVPWWLASEPGWAASNISNKPGLGALHTLARGAGLAFGHDSATAARSTLVAATEPLPGGAYVGFDGARGLRGRVALIGRSAQASDPRAGRWFTAFAADQTGVAMPIGAGARPPR